MSSCIVQHRGFAAYLGPALTEADRGRARQLSYDRRRPLSLVGVAIILILILLNGVFRAACRTLAVNRRDRGFRPPRSAAAAGQGSRASLPPTPAAFCRRFRSVSR